MFVDQVNITIQSGRGGRGCESYIKRPDRKMVPNGGDGGSGGDVVIRADENVGSLISLMSKRVMEAQAGQHGKGSNKYGFNGEPLVLKVPPGTTVFNQTSQLLIRDLPNAGDEVVVAKGGRGGYGNHAGRPATRGEEGTALDLLLSFTIIADIFLVGLPSSGKTAILKKLTGARVEPAHYPFATKAPCLGTYRLDSKSYAICELPSIYKHSSEGRGLGDSFLKHLNRAKLIFLVIDPMNPFVKGMKEGYQVLVDAIRAFNPELLHAPRFVVINKMDQKEAKKEVSKKSVKFQDPHFKISALEGTGLKTLMTKAVKKLKASNKKDEEKFQF